MKAKNDFRIDSDLVIYFCREEKKNQQVAMVSFYLKPSVERINKIKQQYYSPLILTRLTELQEIWNERTEKKITEYSSLLRNCLVLTSAELFLCFIIHRFTESDHVVTGG